ncbi:MAG: hypothetical protein M1831_007433 [Alyxoria varia]|nr:MAG: hypothetical protein M1831_007433 [Alyxoria varia]
MNDKLPIPLLGLRGTPRHAHTEEAEASALRVRRRRAIVSFGLIVLLVIRFIPQLFTRPFNGGVHTDAFRPRNDVVSSTTISPLTDTVGAGYGFDWSTVQAFRQLHFTACYGGQFHCAKLILPLDWHNQSNPKTIDLAVIKLPASVEVTSPSYGGPILLNPGGPGGSGVDLMGGAGFQLQRGLNIPGGKQFDLISFDPRGVGETRPRPGCFSDIKAAFSYFLRFNTRGIPGSSDVALNQLFGMLKAFGKGCSCHSQGERCSESDGIKEHMNTPAVARDMLALVDKHGEWRDRESLQALGPTAQVKRPEAPVEKLQYWGFSYGTLLGATFASLFPDRVSRLVLDGVVEFEDYYGMNWSNNLMDTEKTLSAFYTSCAAAGPSKCALASENSTAADLETVIGELLYFLRHQQPISVAREPRVGDSGPFERSEQPDIITYSDVKRLMFNFLYMPGGWPLLADLLQDLVRGNGASLLEALLVSYQYNCKNHAIIDSTVAMIQAQVSITCSDGADITNKSISDFQEHYDALNRVSPIAGGVWTTISMSCAGWKHRPKWVFNHTDTMTNTSHPILWVSNSADPVTPLANAQKMSKLFPGSRILQQDSAGHCSVSSFSSCTLAKIREYFQKGTLPDEGTICPIDFGPFGDPPPMDQLDSSVRPLREAHRSLSMTLEKIQGGLGQAFGGGGVAFDPAHWQKSVSR